MKPEINPVLVQIYDEYFKCSNPNCITNKEAVATEFDIVEEDPLKIRCKYCERSMSREDIVLIR